MADDDGFNPLEGVGLIVKLAVRILQGPMRYERLPRGTSRSEKVAALRSIERAAIIRSALYGVFAGAIVVLTFAAACALDGRIQRKHRRKFKQLLKISKRPDLAGSLNAFRDYVRDGSPLHEYE